MIRRLLIILTLLCAFSPAALAGIDLSFSPAPDQPFLVTPQLAIDSAEYNTLILTIKSEQAGTARLFWANHYDPQFNQPKSIWFSLKAGTHDYVFNLSSQNPNWIGYAKGFLLYPENGFENIEVFGAELIRGNFLTNLKSGWQEFWGPNGRKVIGSTINTTPASKIFGRPINIYIYWLTVIFFLAIFAWQRDLFKAGKWTIYFALGAWVILALNTDINYYNIFKDNFSKYFGKTIEQKRAITYGQDYYNFLVFAKDKLPKEPVHFGVLSSRYAPELQPRIFLVPHVLVEPSSPKADYLLIFHPEPKQLASAKGFDPYASLNQNAYLLKKFK